jgi:tripartite-type tricarboxylate transporter receptor subunit TctC
VARSAPDGHTLFLGGATILLANKYLYHKGMPFDGIRDFTHISRVSVGSTLFVVNANRPWKTFEEFVADAKRRPGQISAASSGIGTISHLTISKLMKTAGIEVSHVPYRGLAPGLNDLLAGNVDMIFDGMPALMPHVREGRLRALAVGSQKRQPQVAGLENVRGMAELIPGSDMDMEFWYCISAAAGTPAPIVQALHRATIGAARDREYGEKLIPLGFTAISDDTPEGFTEFVRSQDRVWRDLVEISGAKLD